MATVAHDLDAARRSRATILRDGSAVRLREVRPGDEGAVRRFLETISGDSLRRRFFGIPNLDRTAVSLACSDESDDIALVAETVTEGSIVAHAAAYVIGGDRAEVAFLVTDGWQGRGLGSLLLSRLAAAALEREIDTLVADVLPTNRGMLAVFERSGHLLTTRPHGDVTRVRLGSAPLAPPLPLAV